MLGSFDQEIQDCKLVKSLPWGKQGYALLADGRQAGGCKPIMQLRLGKNASPGINKNSRGSYALRIAIICKSSLIWPGHLHRLHPAVELFLGHKTQRQRLLFQGRAVAVRLFGDLGCAVIADMRRESRHQHQGALH